MVTSADDERTARALLDRVEVPALAETWSVTDPARRMVLESWIDPQKEGCELTAPARIRGGECQQVNGPEGGAAHLSDELWQQLSQAFDLDGP